MSGTRKSAVVRAGGSRVQSYRHRRRVVPAAAGRPSDVAGGRHRGAAGHRGRGRRVRRRLRGEPGAVPCAVRPHYLLSAPLETLVERLATRTSNSFAKAPEELRRVLDDVETVDPLLRRMADHEVRTTVPLNEVVTTVLRNVGT